MAFFPFGPKIIKLVFWVFNDNLLTINQVFTLHSSELTLFSSSYLLMFHKKKFVSSANNTNLK